MFIDVTPGGEVWAVEMVDTGRLEVNPFVYR